MSITQKGTVEEYRERFEKVLVEVLVVPNHVVESMFPKGLKRSLRDQVLRCGPNGINDIVAKTRLIEMQESDSPNHQYRQVHRSNFAPQLSQTNRSPNFNPLRGNKPSPVRRSIDAGREPENQQWK